MEKRKFYNAGDAKGFGKREFFEAVAALAAGETVDPAVVVLVGQAADYELEGILNRTSSAAAAGDKKDPLQSDYAVGLATALIPLLPTDEAKAMTAKQLIEVATSKGLVSPNGKDWAAPWVSRVLNANCPVKAAERGVAPTVQDKKIIVDKTAANGLKSQAEATAYFRIA